MHCIEKGVNVSVIDEFGRKIVVLSWFEYTTEFCEASHLVRLSVIMSTYNENI
jgi:hypothetical protein